MYGLIDCNNFYASCEQAFQPQYEGKPVVVFSNNNGCCIIDTEEKRIKALQTFEVADVWGIGRQYAKKMEKYAIRTALELANAPRAWVREQLTVQGERLWCELNGECSVDIDDLDVPKKSICTSRAFGLVHYALRGLDTIYHPDFEYKKAGVIIYDIVSRTAIQGNLFDEYPRDKY